MKTEEGVVISKLEVKIAGEKHSLTIDQARQLYHALGALLAEPKIKVEKEYIYWPKYIWQDNVNIPHRTSPLPWNEIWCSSNDTTKAVLSMEVR